MYPQLIQRDADPLTLSVTTDMLYGGNLLFDICSEDDIIALTLMGRYPKLIDWIGWTLTDVYSLHQNFISYVAASGTAADTPSAATLANVCADGNGVEWGGCDFKIEGFGILRRKSPVRDMGISHLRFCDKQPRYRIDGSRIDSDWEWELTLLAQVMIGQDLARMIITGNKQSVPTAFDGLLRLIKYGYQSTKGDDCNEMNSVVIDWDGQEMCPEDGAVGITLNGDDIDGAWNIIDVLDQLIVDEIEDRVANSQYAGEIGLGDMIIVLPKKWIRCLLQCWTCYHACGNDITRIDTFEARTFRNSLNGGLFGDGQLLNFFGRTVPVMAYDWGLINDPVDEGDPYTANMLVLTRSVNGQRLLYGELLDMRHVPSEAGGNYSVIESNKIVTWTDIDNMCRETSMEMRPRLVMPGPWAQAKILNLACTTFFPKTSVDPQSALFRNSKTVATSA